MDTTFDKSRAAKHEYLGSDLEELRGRTLHDEGSVIWLPILLEPVVLVPGQTLPLNVLYPPTIAMLRDIIAKDKTFGVINFRGMSFNFNNYVKIGTTAEVFQYQEDHDEAGLRIKAKGRQRFRLLEEKQHVPGILSGKVLLLPEVTLLSPLHAGRFNCLDRYRQNIKLRNKINLRDSAATPWPDWVYKQYDPYHLACKLVDELKTFKSDITSSSLPTNPTDLSYWVVQCLPIDDKHRLRLLALDTAIERLQYALTLISKCQKWFCCHCGNHVGDRKNVFSMSIEGPQGTYCNPGGYVYEIMTLYKATGLTLAPDRPSTEYSWFPGYGWTTASCSGCRKHMGWMFTAMSSDLRPREFWGVTRRSVTTYRRPSLNSDDQDDYPLDSIVL